MATRAAGQGEGMVQHIDEVMMEVMEKLQLIVNHLQKFELNRPCNKIAKGANDIITAFMEGTVDLPQDQMEIKIKVEATSKKSPKQNGTPNIARSKEDETLAGTIDINNSSKDSVSQVNMRSRVLGELLGLHPDTSVLTVPSPTRVACSAEQVLLPSGGTVSLQWKPLEPKASKVTVIGIFPQNVLSFLSSKIHEGPLYSIDIYPDKGYAEIIFQHSGQAADFIGSDRAIASKLGYGRFGPGYSIANVQEFMWHTELRKMTQIPRERRRLTFSKAKLLGHHLSFTQFREKVAAAAGGIDAIDIAWAYNSGNVTVVFKSVQVAKTVRQYFVAQSTKNGLFRKLVVTFATDPCERPLLLCSQVLPSANDTACRKPRSIKVSTSQR
ncbi:putative peptide-methionine (S)-S-oxide reductase [Microsporum audouinii]